MSLLMANLSLLAVLVVVVVGVSGANGPPDGPRVCIEQTNGKKYPIHVHLNGTVRQVKETIQRRNPYKVSPSMQILRFNGEPLHDDLSLEHYNIGRHSLLSLEFAPGYLTATSYFFEPMRRRIGKGPKPAKVYVDIHDYDSFDIEVDLTDTADDLKRRIFEQEEYPFREQQIRCDGTIMSGNKTLESYGVASSSVLKLEVPLAWCYRPPPAHAA